MSRRRCHDIGSHAFGCEEIDLRCAAHKPGHAFWRHLDDKAQPNEGVGDLSHRFAAIHPHIDNDVPVCRRSCRLNTETGCVDRNHLPAND